MIKIKFVYSDSVLFVFSLFMSSGYLKCLPGPALNVRNQFIGLRMHVLTTIPHRFISKVFKIQHSN